MDLHASPSLVPSSLVNHLLFLVRMMPRLLHPHFTPNGTVEKTTLPSIEPGKYGLSLLHTAIKAKEAFLVDIFLKADLSAVAISILQRFGIAGKLIVSSDIERVLKPIAQSNKRLPDSSLLTLIASGYDSQHNIATISSWRDTSKLPQRLMRNNPRGDPELSYVLHTIVKYACHYPRMYHRLLTALLSCPLYRDITSNGDTPWSLTAFHGNDQIRKLLKSFGCSEDDRYHPKDIQLRQLIRKPFNFGDHISKYEIDQKSAEVIPQGFNSRVYHVTSLADCIIKVISFKDSPELELRQIANEIMHLNAVSPIYAITANDHQVHVVSKRLKGLTLEQQLPLLMIDKQRIMKTHSSPSTISVQWFNHLHDRIVTPLCYQFHILHQKGALHRDIRPANIIINLDESLESDRIRLIDFGHVSRTDLVSAEARSNDPDFYMVNAPEVAAGGYTLASEMWSIGMILLSLWTCNKPFDNMTTEQVINLDHNASLFFASS
jgi:hypothetical protein